MKRVLTILAILLLPLSVWAMTPVSDSDLSNVTGQAGVNINADLLMNINIGTMAWGDADGVNWGFGWDPATADALGTGADDAGYVGITGFNLTNLRIQARVETDDTYGNYSLSSHDLGVNHLKPITIDVGTDTLNLQGYGAGTTFVRFGLGSLQISMDDMDLTIALGTNGAALTQELGKVYIGGLNMYINSGSYVDIYNQASVNSGQGVTFNMAITVDNIDLDVVSWGDTDGITNGTADGNNFDWYTNSGAGYIGLKNISMGAISVTGSVSIDVNTATASEYLTSSQYLFDNYVGPYLTGIGFGSVNTLVRPTSVSVVHIQFGDADSNFVLSVGGPLTADVKIGNNPQLAHFLDGGATPQGNVKTLGDIYLSNFSVEIMGGSWVDIWAH